MTFEKGQSGNPNGRPKGIVDKRTKLRDLINSHAEEIVSILIEKAKTGDSNALKLCIERIVPKAKPDEAICFDLPEGSIDSGKNMLVIAERITQAVISGQMTLNEAHDFKEFLQEQLYLLDKANQQLKDEE